MRPKDDSFAKKLENIFFGGFNKTMEEQKRISEIQSRQQKKFVEQSKSISKYFDN